MGKAKKSIKIATEDTCYVIPDMQTRTRGLIDNKLFIYALTSRGVDNSIHDIRASPTYCFTRGYLWAGTTQASQ